MRQDILKLLYGLLARLVSTVVPVKKGLWIFGADFGNMYREGSKYMLEYMLSEHPEYDCLFVTQSDQVCRELRGKGIPCVMNFSLRGLWIVARSECVFTTQIMQDILYAFRKKGRRFYYLVHGQPLKVAIAELAKTAFFEKEVFLRDRPKFLFWRKTRAWLRTLFVSDTTVSDSEFVSATSEFLSKWQKKDFGKDMTSKILGMPRNDALFQPSRMEKEKWIEGTEGRMVVSYMPTHRLYGRGLISPTPFEKRLDIQTWMRDHNILLVVKNHPNMLLQKRDKIPYESECIRDITAAGIDPMTVLYRSDAIITDYSSVWMDYLLLKRPIFFYIYDDFVHDDVGVYYDVRAENVGQFCYTEDELFLLIKRLRTEYSALCPAETVVRKFHKYVDGKSCERYFNAVTGGHGVPCNSPMKNAV